MFCSLAVIYLAFNSTVLQSCRLWNHWALPSYLGKWCDDKCVTAAVFSSRRTMTEKYPLEGPRLPRSRSWGKWGDCVPRPPRSDKLLIPVQSTVINFVFSEGGGLVPLCVFSWGTSGKVKDLIADLAHSSKVKKKRGKKSLLGKKEKKKKRKRTGTDSKHPSRHVTNILLLLTEKKAEITCYERQIIEIKTM